MGDITIHLEPAITNDSIRKVEETLPRVGKNDHIIIVMEATDAHQADRVMEVLEARGFDYQPHGSNDGRAYQIIGKRIQ